MEEREINFTTNEDRTILELSKENKKSLMDVISKQISTNSHIFNMIKDHKLEKGMTETLSSLMESYLKEIHTMVDYNSVLKKEYNQRYIEIKAANRQNHELRKQLGLKVSAEDVRECLKNLEKTIRNWWDAEGMGYVKDFEFCPYVIRAKLSCSESIGLDKKLFNRLIEKGYSIGGERDNKAFLATEENMKLLEKELILAFPSATLFRGEIWFSKKVDEENTLWDVSITIHNYDDVLNIKYKSLKK
jgi:hypothetical protein